ncbi:carboxymuconolactone decarboxylase family protein [Rhodococcus sp. HNM0569]|uniref:carboxymuconolactone decarboxylase family protein n=1 Tax=Rhodococcus sp. HNM0569 TaxID=2716340 RepID=UPI00146F1062|nr:carboxymuconolactone decarboxylase family protein [Rhodococcus sp. HNM0569]NLU83100.1 carboxymuconolactone decarboxylase family protein [Rhodococcus sp. HNM0569]
MTARIRPGRLRALGPVNWVLWRVLSRGAGTTDAHLFSTLGRAKGLFRGWLFYSAHLMPGGRLSRFETELIILRVAHLRGSAYEFDHHTRLGRRAGVTDALRERVVAGPDTPGWSPREHALLGAVDRLVETKDLDDETWHALAEHLDERRLIEFCLLVTQYDGLATTIRTLRIERDFPA